MSQPLLFVEKSINNNSNIDLITSIMDDIVIVQSDIDSATSDKNYSNAAGEIIKPWKMMRMGESMNKTSNLTRMGESTNTEVPASRRSGQSLIFFLLILNRRIKFIEIQVDVV
jgi:hypothetical protein